MPCGSRIGWGAFTGNRTLLLLTPVETCANYNDLMASLDRIDGRMRWSNASEVGKGVYWAVKAAQETGSTPPNILFVSDGQESPPLQSGEFPALFDELDGSAVRGWLVGAGGDEPMPIPKSDAEGAARGFWRSDQVIQSENTLGGATPGLEHRSAVREQYLQTLAQRLHLDYLRMTDQSSLSKAMQDSRFARRRPVPTDFSWLAAALALVLLAVRFRPRFSLRAMQEHLAG
jgi:mxaL protein